MTGYSGHVWQDGETITEVHLQAIDDAARDAVPRAEVATLTTAVSVKAFPFYAKGDATTDDTAAIQAALNAALHVYFPAGTYITTTDLVIRGGTRLEGGGETYATIKRSAASSHAAAMLVSQEWVNNATYVGAPIEIEHLTIDGNKAGNSTAIDSVLLMNYRCRIHENTFVNSSKNDIHFVDVNRAGAAISTTAVENRIYDNKLSAAALTAILISDTANKLTDGFITDNIISDCGAGIMSTRGAGWIVEGNHVYNVAGSGISVTNGFATRVIGNYVEGFGTTYSDGGYPAGISVSVAGVRASVVQSNEVYVDTESTTNGNLAYHYLRVTGNSSPSTALITDNHAYGVSGSLGQGLVLQTASGYLYAYVAGNAMENFQSYKDVYLGGGVSLGGLSVPGGLYLSPLPATNAVTGRVSGSLTSTWSVTAGGRAAFSDGVATREVNSAGMTSAQIDALFTTVPPNGTMASDPTNGLLLARQGGKWYKTAALVQIA